MKFSVLVRMLKYQLKNLCPCYLKNLSHGCISLVGSIKTANSKLSPSRTSPFLEVLTHDLLEYTSGDKVSLTLQSLPTVKSSQKTSHFAPLLTFPQCINFKWGYLSWRYATKVVMTVHHQELLFLILSSTHNCLLFNFIPLWFPHFTPAPVSRPHPHQHLWALILYTLEKGGWHKFFVA